MKALEVNPVIASHVMPVSKIEPESVSYGKAVTSEQCKVWLNAMKTEIKDLQMAGTFFSVS